MCTGLNVTVHPTGLPGQYQGTCEYFVGNMGAVLMREVQMGSPDTLHRAQHLEERPALGRLSTISVASRSLWGGGVLGTKGRGIMCRTRFSTVEEGSMHVHFVSTDYNHLILYVRLEDNEVINLWALLGR